MECTVVRDPDIEAMILFIRLINPGNAVIGSVLVMLCLLCFRLGRFDGRNQRLKDNLVTITT